jgi:hypothetical protein
MVVNRKELKYWKNYVVKLSCTIDLQGYIKTLTRLKSALKEDAIVGFFLKGTY